MQTQLCPILHPRKDRGHDNAWEAAYSSRTTGRIELGISSKHTSCWHLAIPKTSTAHSQGTWEDSKPQLTQDLLFCYFDGEVVE